MKFARMPNLVLPYFIHLFRVSSAFLLGLRWLVLSSLHSVCPRASNSLHLTSCAECLSGLAGFASPSVGMASFEAAAHHYNQMHADDDLDQYEPTKRAQMLQEQFKTAEQKFDSLVQELHIPFLDRKLYRKYFIAQQSERNLECLLSIVDALHEHKNHTLKLLKCIFEREQVVNVIKVMASDYAKGKLSTLEVLLGPLQA